MDKLLLYRDLNLKIIIDTMSEDSEQLRNICHTRLMTGFNVIHDISHHQVKLKKMIQNKAHTKDIFNICCNVDNAIVPQRNYLHPRNANALTPQKKLTAYITIILQIGEGLCEIYKIQNELEKKSKLEKQLKELKKISQEEREEEISLSGCYGEGLYASNILLEDISTAKTKKHKSLFHFISSTSKEYISTEENYQVMFEYIQKLKNSIAYNLLRIVISFEQKLSKELNDIKTEYGFGLGAINLWCKLQSKGIKTSYPKFTDSTKRTCSSIELVELSIALKDNFVIGNTVNLDQKQIMLITGANQGGKTTFLRSIGQAQLMAQCGLFVAAEEFVTEIHSGIFTHFPDEEDPLQNSGLLEQELVKLDEIIDCLDKKSMLLLNETFLTTTEFNAYQLSTEITMGLLLSEVKVFFVTHNYLFSSKMYEKEDPRFSFLKAMINTEQSRTYKIIEGCPDRSAYAKKLYDSIVYN